MIVILADPVSECWVDINEVLPCGNNAFKKFFASDGEVPTDAFGIQLCNVETDNEVLPEVSISELESLLLMDGGGEIASGTGQRVGYITCNAEELETVQQVSKFDFVCCDIQEPATVSYDVDEDTSSEEDDSHDTTWSYRNSRPKCRRRSKLGRRLSATRRNTVDERKKQQNKSAATRYREKKRSEEIQNEALCAELEKRNKELRTRVQDMTREVAVMRQLVVDIFRSPTACTA